MRPFLSVFPREIRDQIYISVLANSVGQVRLYPWTVDVARSLSILRTCKQVFRECKDIIWEENGLSQRSPCQLFDRFASQSKLPIRKRLQHIKISLELLDRDELEWMRASLKALASWSETGSLKTITLVTDSDRPRTVEEFREALMLRESGETVDGRLYMESHTRMRSSVNTGWPRFSHWGKQAWLKEMLLDPSGIEELVKELHNDLGGELFIDGVLCFKDGTMVRKSTGLNPRKGEIKIIMPRRSMSWNRR